MYAERFAHFFSRRFFVRKCFESLHSEVKPEHAGFRAAVGTLYAEYASLHGLVHRAGVETRTRAPRDAPSPT